MILRLSQKLNKNIKAGTLVTLPLGESRGDGTPNEAFRLLAGVLAAGDP